ncbi:MAG: hypothetical protein LQ337_004827 [Flavoplaca oasis]|nr:MAG: hypothetical protein LQ337_004827 [Flavoplaca oasis]
MEFNFSRLVDRAEYDLEGLEGLCDGIPVREHNHKIYEDIGAIRAQQDWHKLVQPLSDYKGGLAASFNFMSIAVPECIPERLEIISYANEFAFLHDDITDNVDQAQGDEENDAMLAALRQGAETGTIDFNSSGKNKIQMQILKKMLALDHERALTSTKAWAKFVQLAAGRQNDVAFATLEEYIPYRMLDVGEMFWFGMVTFGMAITIPEEEMGTCKRLMRPAWIVAGLQNDLFSWEKEHETARRLGRRNVINAIWVLMQEHSINVNEAKDMCRRIIKDNVSEYLNTVESKKDDRSLSSDLRRYLEAMKYTLSGNAVWSLICPRYHPTATFNAFQKSLMRPGVISGTPQAVIEPSGDLVEIGRDLPSSVNVHELSTIGH